MLDQVSVALIGCGYWGSKLKRYLKENPDFRLERVCDSKSNLNDVWKDSRIAAIVVATPNDSHYSIVKLALLHGKNVLSEKPLALKVEECEELKQIALNNNLLLLVDYTWTFSKGLQKVQRKIKGEEIGKIIGVEMAVRRFRRYKGGSVYWLLGSHMLSVLDMFIPIEDLSFEKVDLVSYDGEVDTGIISFSKEGLLGQIIVSLNFRGKETRIIVYGEKGIILHNPIAQPTLQVEKYGPLIQEEYTIDESNNLGRVIQHFSRALQGKAEGNVDRAIAVTRVLEELGA